MAEPDRHYSEQGRQHSDDPKFREESKSVWKSEVGSDSKRGYQAPSAASRPTGKRR